MKRMNARTGHIATAIAAIAFALGSTVWWIGFSGGLNPKSDYEVRAVLPTASSLAPRARVTMAGATVGAVSEVKQKGTGSVVELAIQDEDVLPLPADSTVRVRSVTAVGENYVEITPGRSKATIAPGGVVPIEQAGKFVDADEVLSILQGETRQRARDLLQGTGAALRGRDEELNGTVRGVADTITPLATTMLTLAEDRKQVSRLIEQLGDVSAAVGERGASLRSMARDAVITFRATADRDRALRSMIEELPGTLRQVKATTRTLQGVSRASTPVVREVAATLDEARPVITGLRPAAQDGREVVRELAKAAPPLQTTLSELRRVSPAAAKTLPALRRVLCETAPALRYLEPYRADVTSFIGGFGSAVNSYDPLSHLVRLTPVLGENSIAGLPDELSKVARDLVHSGILSQSTTLNWNPYPKPGMAGKSTANGSPEYLGPEDFAKRSGYVYPRIKADC